MAATCKTNWYVILNEFRKYVRPHAAVASHARSEIGRRSYMLFHVIIQLTTIDPTREFACTQDLGGNRASTLATLSTATVCTYMYYYIVVRMTSPAQQHTLRSTRPGAVAGSRLLTLDCIAPHAVTTHYYERERERERGRSIHTAQKCIRCQHR